MHHHIIDRNAECRRKSLETLAHWNGSIVANILLTNIIKKSRGYTRANMTANLRESFPEEEADFTYKLYFFFGLEQYHFILFKPELT